MDKKDFYKKIIHRYVTNQATEEELEAFFAIVESADMDDELQSYLKEEAAKEDDNSQHPYHRRLWTRIAAAASILFILSVSGYFLIHKTDQPELTVHNDVQPFTGRTLLRTGHGPAVVLDQRPKGYINTAVQKTGSDEIVYSTNTSKIVTYDTLEVTAGGRPYHLKLSDGSEVIANVATKIRFPENFRQGSSQIEILEGEAYFKIVHNTFLPVSIKSKKQLIADIGTEFNVNAYANEPETRTTLIEGNVAVNSQKLKPGLQAITRNNNTVITTASLLHVTAWKDGYFRFNGDHIDAIMRQLARWYNIEVKYEGKVTDEAFYGRVNRKRNISEVLRILERSKKVQFIIEGRRVTVLSR